MGMTEYIDTSYTLSEKSISDFETVNVGFEKCPSGYGYGPTLRPYHLIHFVTGGCGKLTINGMVFNIYAGDAFLIPAEQISYYQADSDDPWSYSWIGFLGVKTGSFVQGLLASSREHYVFRKIDTQKYALEIEGAAKLDEVCPYSYFHANSTLLKICSYLSGDVLKPSVYHKKLSLAENIKFYIDAKYNEKIKLADLADMFHIHPNHLTRIFRETFGTTPKRYLSELKMNKAIKLLETTDMPITLISTTLGFDDQLSFSKAFHQYFGNPPSYYRRR